MQCVNNVADKVYHKTLVSFDCGHDVLYRSSQCYFMAGVAAACPVCARRSYGDVTKGRHYVFTTTWATEFRALVLCKLAGGELFLNVAGNPRARLWTARDFVSIQEIT